MLNSLLEILAPATFTKGIFKFNKGDYLGAARLLKKSAKWMPDLKNDGMFKVYSLLVDHNLGKHINIEEVKTAIDKLANSSYKNHKSYIVAEIEINNLLRLYTKPK